MKHKLLLILSFLFLGMILTACNFGAGRPTTTLDIRVIETQVAGTLIAQRTQQAGEEAVTRLTEIAQQTAPVTPASTSTLAPTNASQTTATFVAPTATPTQAPTATQIPPSPTATQIPPSPTATQIPPSPTATQLPPSPTATQLPPSPTATPVPPTPIPPTPTPRPTPCNSALFIKDISVPDGTTIFAGTQFIKTWRIKNNGTCKWTREYSVVYQSGDLMGAVKEQWFETTINSGDTVDISVAFTAPPQVGKHTGYWKLRNQDGVFFGIGENATEAFWVTIKVVNPNSLAYSFAENYCNAKWSSSEGTIPCQPPTLVKLSPGSTIVEEGNVITGTASVGLTNNPQLENGSMDNEPTLVVFPNDGSGGYIAGMFPKRKIQNGDWFRAVIGCMYGHPNCNVTFKLQYSVDGGAVQTLGTWTQTYDGKIEKINIDLSFLADKQVIFIFKVENNGSSEGDSAFWLHPRIVR